MGWGNASGGTVDVTRCWNSLVHSGSVSEPQNVCAVCGRIRDHSCDEKEIPAGGTVDLLRRYSSFAHGGFCRFLVILSGYGESLWVAARPGVELASSGNLAQISFRSLS